MKNILKKAMVMKRKNNKKFKRPQNPLNKLSLFQKSSYKFSKTCPLSVKDAPVISYKNIKLLRKYISDTNKILPSRITSVSQNKQRKLTNEIKRAKVLGLI